MDKINLINGEALEEMDKLIEQGVVVDSIICDLPYGTTKNDWDKRLDYKKMWSCFTRIIKDNGAIILFAQSPFDKELAMSNIKLFRYEWIWEKTNATGFLNAQKMPLKAHENILVFYKKLPTYNPIKTKGHKKVSLAKHKVNCKQSSNYGKQMHTKDYCSDERYPRSVLEFKSDKQKGNFHDTQKPLKLMEYLVKTYTNEDELVLDATMGSGTTILACKNLNRRAIGIELDKNYFEIAKNRIENSKYQGELF